MEFCKSSPAFADDGTIDLYIFSGKKEIGVSQIAGRYFFAENAREDILKEFNVFLSASSFVPSSHAAARANSGTLVFNSSNVGA